MRAWSVTAALLVAIVAAPAFAAEPVVAIWYRGTPAGMPRLDDLAAIRAVGFGGVTWPSGNAKGFAELSRLADIVGLKVVLQPAGAPLQLEGRLDIPVAKVRPSDLPALVWRAVARGVRTISIDPGQSVGTGLGDSGREAPPWVAPAVALARQLSGNAPLVDDLAPGPAPAYLSGRSPALDVALLEGPRCWVVVATNTGRSRASATVELAAAVPYAIWVSLIDGSTIAMLDRPTGPRWTLQLEPGGAGAYVIDKVAGR